MRITSTGDVGIGTSSPASLLSLGSAIAEQKLLMYDSTENNLKYGFGLTSGELRMFSTAGALITFGGVPNTGVGYTEHMRIDTNTGDVGIGTSSPASKLHLSNGVGSTSEIRMDGAANQQFRLQSNANGYTYLYNYGSGGMIYQNINASEHGWGTSNSRKMTLTAAGDLGIGTTSPTASLEVVGTANSRRFFVDEGVTANHLKIGSKLSNESLGYLEIHGYEQFFYTNNGFAGAFDVDGNFGLGLSAPLNKLHITSGAIRQEEHWSLFAVESTHQVHFTT
jgi:hypothetical protein